MRHCSAASGGIGYLRASGKRLAIGSRMIEVISELILSFEEKLILNSIKKVFPRN